MSCHRGHTVKQEIERLNNLTHDAAEAELLQCCGSTAWACGMSARRPFGDMDDVMRAAAEAWSGLEEPDWLEAFSRHPQIGESKSATAQTMEEQAWSTHEQSGLDETDAAARRELAELNREYEQKFGYIFIVCATGKTAAEILALLMARMGNDPETELKVAAEEQRRITRLRLEKLLSA
ncbi:MAG: allantoicase [Acidobacteriota bacterium]|nr:allantoicase [Acidobacteriota bacterium]